jgi:cation diffusion facilitator family transporter
MPDTVMPTPPAGHGHIFLGEGQEHAERRTWSVIWLCGSMMLVEIVGGSLFGSIALVADGMHMSTHAGAMFLAALAYRYARKHATDARFTFGTGKLGDLAGFTSAIILAMIALLIGNAAVSRVISPVPIHFGEAIPIAVLGLAVNVASARLLACGEHRHHGHHHPHGEDDNDHHVLSAAGTLLLAVLEVAHPPVFRLRAETGSVPDADVISIETIRPGGRRQSFLFDQFDGYLQSRDTIPEPHAFEALVNIDGRTQTVTFEEHAHDHGKAHRDNNMRAAVFHVAADAAVSVLVIVSLILARALGWLWMDPLAGLLGAGVIASWSYGLIRDTGTILLDMNPNRDVADRVRKTVESEGDRVTDFHLWRLGPGHLGAIVGVVTAQGRDSAFYRNCLGKIRSISHVTVDVEHVV